MTIFMADIASYQGTLTPDQLLAAGVTAVNVKVSHGLTLKSVHDRAFRWLADDRFTHSTFHWLTADASGEAQATYAYRAMELVGAVRPGVAHVVDVEAPGVTATQYMDYVLTMRGLLGRDIATYTGDWYWPASWRGANISPWLHAAPNVGYLGSYPGDTSLHWGAGYGGWGELAVMQYGVLPIDGIRVSMSAIRDATLWERMRGVPMPTLVPCLVQLRDEFNRINPNRDKASDGWIGDPAHQASKSDHNPDSRGLVHAIDVDETGPWDGESMMQKVERLRLRCKSGAETRLTYIIYEGHIASPVQDWGWRAYSGANPHDKHAHFSASYTPAKERDTSTWGAAKPPPPPPPKEPDMTKAELIDFLKSDEGKRLVGQAVWTYEIKNAYSGNNIATGTQLAYVPSRQPHQDTQSKVDALDAAQRAYEESENATDAAVVQALQEIKDMLTPPTPESPAGA